MQKRQHNPLVLEFQRSNRRGWLIVLMASLMFGLLAFLQHHHQRDQHHAMLLRALTIDFQHQLAPHVTLLQQLQQDSAVYLAQPTNLLIATDSLVNVLADSAQKVTPAERSMLNSMASVVGQLNRLHQDAPVGYFSNRGAWFDGATNLGTESIELLKQRLAPLQQRNSYQRDMLSWFVKEQHKLMIAIPVHLQTEQGFWIVAVDMVPVLKKLTPLLEHATLVLLSEHMDALVSVQDGQLVPTTVAALRQNDLHQPVDAFPFALHLQPNTDQLMYDEFLFFCQQLIMVGCLLAFVHLYLRWRFKKHVLGPAARLSTHWNRLERGDAVGVRHIPSEWRPWFEQADRIANKTNLKDPPQ